MCFWNLFPQLVDIIHPQKEKWSVQPFCFWGEHSKGLSNQADVELDMINAISAEDIAFIMLSSQGIVNWLNALNQPDFSQWVSCIIIHVGLNGQDVVLSLWYSDSRLKTLFLFLTGENKREKKIINTGREIKNKKNERDENENYYLLSIGVRTRSQTFCVEKYYNQTKWSEPLKITLTNWLCECWTR